MTEIEILDYENFDSLLSKNENDYYIRYFIDGAIEGAELDDLPFFRGIKKEVGNRLVAAGFLEGVVKDPARVREFAALLDKFPFKLPNDQPMATLEIIAGLHALAEVEDIRPLIKDETGKEIYLRTIKMMVDLFRAGSIPALVTSEKEKKGNSLSTRNFKKILIRVAILNIFEKYPNSKTVGNVWNKLNTMNITDNKTRREYHIKTSKNKAGEDVILITGDGLKKPLSYKKRTLERLVKEVKNLKL